MKTLAVANQKGGVGKTTTAVTLAHGLALKGKRVLLIDLDPQGQCATAMNLAHEDGVYSWLVMERPFSEVVRRARPNMGLIPGDKQTATVQMLWGFQNRGIDALAQKMKALANGLDYCVLDTSPSVGGMQERAIYAANFVIVPVKVDYLSADAVSQTVATMYDIRGYGWSGGLFGILPTFYDRRIKENRRMLDELRSLYPGQVLDPIHYRKTLPECAAEGKTIWEMDGGSDNGQEYAGLLYELMEV